MKSTDAIMDHGRTLCDLALTLAKGDTGQQMHLLLQAVAAFAAQYEQASALLQIAIDTLTATRDEASRFAAERTS